MQKIVYRISAKSRHTMLSCLIPCTCHTNLRPLIFSDDSTEHCQYKCCRLSCATLRLSDHICWTTNTAYTSVHMQTLQTRMWANAQRDGRPAKYRWRPLFNAAKFG